jgi:uncharacterized protein YxjI
MSGPPSYQGWLDKSGYGMHKKRYFELRGNKLTQYSSDGPNKGVDVEVKIEDISEIKVTLDNHFEIKTPSTTLHLSAVPKSEAEKWVAILEESRAYFKNLANQPAESSNPPPSSQVNPPPVQSPPPQQSTSPQMNPYPQQGQFPPQQPTSPQMNPYPQQYPPQQGQFSPQQPMSSPMNSPMNPYPQQYPPQQGPFPPQQPMSPPMNPYPQQYPPQQGQFPPQQMQYPPQQYYPPQQPMSPYPQQVVYQQPYGQYPGQMGFQPIPINPAFPHRYKLKEKLFSFTGDIKIEDYNGNEIFLARGAFWSIGSRMSFQDIRTGQELAYIAQVIRIGMPHYEVYRNGMLVATIRDRFTIGDSKFDVELHNIPHSESHHRHHHKDMVVTGDWYSYEYVFRRGDVVVANASRKFFSLQNTYGIEIDPYQDHILILSIAVVIDHIVHNRGNNNPYPGGMGMGMGMGYGDPLNQIF